MSSARPSKSRVRFTRIQLQQRLEILNAAVAAPFLPPTLPPSPPESRSASPTPSATTGSRRKLPPDAASSGTQHSKRARTSLQHTDVHQQDASTRPVPPPARKIEEDTQPVASTSTVPTTAPTPGGPESVSFPHRRGRPSAADFNRFYDRYSSYGKQFKYSAERGPQERKSPAAYAIHAQLFSRIEALDALLNFTYAMWCKDMIDNKCHHALWDTIDQFLKWVRARWETSETRGEPQRAFIGIIRMVEAYIYARKAAFLNTANVKRFGEVDKMVKPPQPTLDPASSISPATSLGGSSQHSVPNASPPTGSCPSPMVNQTTSRPVQSNSSHPPPSTVPPPKPAGPTVQFPKDLYDSLQAAHNCNTRSARAMSQAMIYLNIPVLSRCFPRTAARIQAGQLRYEEEYEVDFDQDECSRTDGVPGVGLGGDLSPGPGEGQLVWPGALNSHTGDGVAWVCLLGRAMIRELGYPLGYRGLEVLVKKDVPAR